MVEDLFKKVKRAAETKGTTFVHVLSPCPPGWRIPSNKSIEVSRLAVDTKVFPLYEVINGEEYRITFEPKDLPVEEYLKLQGRYSHLTPEDIEYIQSRVDYEWKVLLQRSMMEPYHMIMP
jgi:pyruvate/2-oxoacid:ferredoxin oxidoreductase beta subunit